MKKEAVAASEITNKKNIFNNVFRTNLNPFFILQFYTHFKPLYVPSRAALKLTLNIY